MRANSEIERDVAAELRWNPQIDETDIAIKANQGAVTLTGYVHSYPEKYRAEAAAKRVAGVSAIANDIEVRLTPSQQSTDPQIARDALAALKKALPAQSESIKVLIHAGRVALEGTAQWHFERDTAERVVGHVQGVVSVRNSIRLEPRHIIVGDIKDKIEAAFRRRAGIDSDNVSVALDGSEVVLRGEVRSWAERDEAQATAWSAPGVTHVRNEISVRT